MIVWGLSDLGMVGIGVGDLAQGFIGLNCRFTAKGCRSLACQGLVLGLNH